MIRWILVCVLLSAIAVAAVWAVAPKTVGETVRHEKPAVNNTNEAPRAPDSSEPDQPVRAAPAPAIPASQRALPQLLEYGKISQQTITEPIIIPNCHLLIEQQQEVPTEKEGKLLFIGTDVLPGEIVPPEKKLPDAELGFLAIPVGKDEQLLDGEKPFQFENNSTWYRRARDTDQLEPGKIALAREFRPVRKLQVGDKVKRGQLLALVNPRKSFDEVAIRVSKINQADADRLSSQKQKEEFQRRHISQVEQNRITPGSVPKDDYQSTLVQREKFAYEEKAKAAEVTKTQRELNAALTDLRMHEVRAAIDGTVKVIYKNIEGEAVKPMESVLQIQNSGRLRVEGMLEVQEALKLKEHMPVIVEASRPEHPRLVISGHLNTVNCVAVSKGKRPIILSGSEDETLRGWDSVNGDKLWLMSGLKSAVRSVACTPPGSKHDLVLFRLRRRHGAPARPGQPQRGAARFGRASSRVCQWGGLQPRRRSLRHVQRGSRHHSVEDGDRRAAAPSNLPSRAGYLRAVRLGQAPRVGRSRQPRGRLGRGAGQAAREAAAGFQRPRR